MKERQIDASRFKAQCLALLDQVARTGRPILITHRGRPVARLVPLQEIRAVDLTVFTKGDVVSSLETAWESDG